MRTTIFAMLALLCAWLPAAMADDEGLVLHYTFEEGAGAVLKDRSGNGLDGKIHGARWVKGAYGAALEFDGKDDFVECPSGKATDTPDAFTAEAWAFPRAHGGGVFCRVTGGGWADLRLTLTNFQRDGKQPFFLFCLADGKKYNSTQRPQLELNAWTHVAATFDGKTVKVYRNGALETSYGAGCKADVQKAPLWIGRSLGIGDRPFFNGRITDVRYYSRAISAAEVRKHHQAGLKGRAQIALALRAARPPEIDGRLNEAEWTRAAGYRVGPLLDSQPQIGTRFKLLYDNENLYIAYECLEPTKTEQLASGKKVRAGGIWNYDSLEFFLDPDAQRERYHHFAASPVAGQFYDDQTGFRAPFYQDELWHEPWTFASHVDVAAKRWTMEVAIPFESLGVDAPKPGDVWLGNFGRQRPPGWQVSSELFLWSRLGRRFNDAGTFGPISFDTISPLAERLAAAKKIADKFMPRKPSWPDPSVKTVGALGEGRVMIPTNQVLKPAGKQITYPGRPLDMALSPDGKWTVVTNLRDVTLIDLATGIKQIVPLPDGRANSFHGVLFLPDSRTIYCSGATGEIFVFAINGDGRLRHKSTHKVATRAPCGLAFSDDGKHLYVADGVGNALVVCDVATLQPIAKAGVGVAPYSVAVGPNGKVYVSNWGGRHANPAKEAFGWTYAGAQSGKAVIDPKTGRVNNGTVSVVRPAVSDADARPPFIIKDRPGDKSDWSVKDGAIVQNSNLYSQGPQWAGTRLLMGDAKWTDYTLTCRLMSRDNDRIGLILRRQSADNLYRFRWQIEKYGDPCYQANLEKCVNGKWTILAHADIPFKQKKWYTVTFRSVGSRIEVSVPDVNLTLSADDGSIKTGGIALYCSGNTGSYFDDVVVTGNGRELLREAFDRPDGKLGVVQEAAEAGVSNIVVGRFPCQIILNARRTRLFVANGNDDTVSVVDTATDKVVETIPTRPDGALPFGSQPNALVLSRDEKTLYVANATNNAVSVIALGRSAGVAGGPERSHAIGMIPVGWFPGAIKLSGDGKQLYVANVRGLGAGFSESSGAYRVGNFIGLVNIIDVPDDKQLVAYTRQVSENNRVQASLLAARPSRKGDKRVPVPTQPGESSVFEHVIYIIRENHTYDMDLGDMKEGEGDPRLCSSGEMLTPNAHAIARQFVLLDNYHVPSVQSPTGHLWISQGITSSYYEKGLTTWPRRYSYSGGDALAFAGCDFIWLNALKHGRTFRNYGEAVNWSTRWTDAKKEGKPKWIDAWNDYKNGTRDVTVQARGNIAPMRPHVAPNGAGYGYVIPDVYRAKVFIDDMKKFEKEGGFPNFSMVFLPNNHTSGSRPGFPSASAQVADNDVALGMIAEAVSRSKFWPKTVIFCVEDDPANGSDHVAGSRSLCYIISPYTKRGKVISECYSLCGVLKTMELILGLPMMNQLDLLATPLTECFTDKPDFTPYTLIPSKIPLDTLNPELATLTGPALFWARKSMELPLMDEPDAFIVGDLDIFQRLNWYALVGHDRPYAHVKDGKVVFEDPLKYVP